MLAVPAAVPLLVAVIEYVSTSPGSAELLCTPLTSFSAWIAGPRPALLTVMSNPIGLPATTGPAGFATLATWIWAGCTQTEADESSMPALLLVTWPVLSTVPAPGQSPAVSFVVVLVMWTVKVLRASVVLAGTVTPRAPPQVRTRPLMTH